MKQFEAFHKQNKISKTSGTNETDGRGIIPINSVQGLGFASQQQERGSEGGDVVDT